MSASSTVRVVFLGDSASAVRSVRTLEGSLGGLGRAAKLAMHALGVGVVGSLALAVKSAIDFDKSMRQVNSLLHLSEGRFKSLEKQVLSLARETGQAPKTLAAGLYDVVSSGFKAGDAIKVLRASAKAATAGLTDTATSTKAVVAVLNAYHLGAGQAARVSDVLFQTVNRGVLTFEELAAQIGDVLPIAAQLGVPLEDVGGALATITLHGVNAAEASTQLKQTLVSILKPSEDLQKQIHAMGFESGEAALKSLGLEGVMRKLTVASHGSGKAFADWFPNVRAMNGALGITGKNIQTLHSNIEAMNRSQGATGAAFAEQGKSIAVQWAKAKAALTAAAIPVGELLFPALKAGAEKVAEFAASVEAHLPQIKQRFQELADVTTTVGGAAARVGTSQTGLSGIVAALATIGAGRSILGAMKMKEALFGLEGVLARLGPVGMAAAGAIGFLTFAIMNDLQHVRPLADSYERLNKAFKNSAEKALTHREALNQLEQAHLNVASTAMQVEGAERAYQQAVKRSGKESDEAKAAFVNLRQARLNHKRAVEDETAAERNAIKTKKESGQADRDRAKELKKNNDLAEEARKGYDNVLQSQQALAKQSQNDPYLQAEYATKAAANLKAYAKAIGGIIRGLGGTKGEAKAAEGEVAELTRELGRLPTVKEVQIRIHTTNMITDVEIGRMGTHTEGRPRSRAMGGFIPGATGQAVPVLAHAGEIILNPSQQMKLGGPRYLAQLFGFHGEAGPAFAGGGVVGHKGLKPKPGTKPKVRRQKVRPYHPRGRKSVNQAEAEIVTLEHAIDDDQHYASAAARTYDQMDAKFALADRGQETILTDEDGIETLNLGFISQRVGELQQLIDQKDVLVHLFEDEQKKLRELLEAVQAAIRKLVAAIKKAQEDARREQKLVTQLAGRIARERAKKKDKHGKGGPNEAQITEWERQKGLHETNASKATDQVKDLQGKLQDHRDALITIPRDITFAGQDAEDRRIEQAGLRADIADLSVPKLQARVDGDNARTLKGRSSGDSSGSGGSFSSFEGSSAPAVDVSALLAEIGRLKLVLGLEAVQLPILGSFQKGTLHVPETGLYQLHAGESVTTAGSPSRTGADAPINVNMHFADGMEWLREFVTVTIDNSAGRLAPKISEHIGREADTRRRAGTC